MKSKFKSTIFVIITIFFVLTTLEIAFRIMYSIKYKNPQYMMFNFRDVFKVNIDLFNGYKKFKEPVFPGDELYHGFRTAQFAVEKPEGEYRIVALGGSATFGLRGGYRKSWPYLLEKKLNDRLEKYTYRVINAGVMAQTTFGVNRLLKAEVLNWKPDVVIIYSLYNHVFIDEPGIYKRGKTADYVFRKIKGLLYNKSLLVTYLMNVIGLRSQLTLKNKMETYRYLLTDMINECKQEDVKIFIVKQLINPSMFLKVKRTSCTRDGNKVDPNQYVEFLTIIDEIGNEYKNDCVIIDFSAYSPECKNRLDELLTDYVHLIYEAKEMLTEAIYAEINKLQ